MKLRKTFILVLLSLPLLALPGCKNKKEKSQDPQAEADENKDPVVVLEEIQGEVQAEIDLVLQPITDATELIDNIATMPERYGITLGDLSGMAKAAYSDGEVSVKADLDITAEAKAELEATLLKLKEIGLGLKATPERASKASLKLTALGTKLTAVATAATTKLNAKVAAPIGVSAEAKADAQAQIQQIAGLKTSITGQIQDAKAKVTGLPAEATSIGVKLLASFAGAGKASAGS